MLVSVSAAGRGRGLLDLPRNPPARSRSLSAANANPLQGLCVCVYECVYLRFVCNSSCRKRDDGNGLDLFMEKGF